MSALVIRGDAANLALPDSSVDLIITSPPYFGLRSYTDGGKHYDGQVGEEASAAEYLEALWACTEEWMRVLKPTGSMWVNLGDKYATGTTPPAQGATGIASRERTLRETAANPRKLKEMVRNKSLNGLPWRYAIGCMDYFDLLLRRDQIWHKANGLPETVRDRTRSQHEYWFHFTKQGQYFSAVDEIREPTVGTHDRGPNAKHSPNIWSQSRFPKGNPLGRVPGSVWLIPTESGLVVPDYIAHRRCCGVTAPGGRAMTGCDEGLAHYAAFPMEFPRRLIAGWSPSGICTVCGEGRRPLTEMGPSYSSQASTLQRRGDRERQPGNTNHTRGPDGKIPDFPVRERRVVGEVCACPDTSAPTTPARVLDPFGGTGTVALVAHVMDRLGISNDMSEDYCRMAQWRTSDRGEWARAMQVVRPPKPVIGQEELFGLEMLT